MLPLFCLCLFDSGEERYACFNLEFIQELLEEGRIVADSDQSDAVTAEPEEVTEEWTANAEFVTEEWIKKAEHSVTTESMAEEWVEGTEAARVTEAAEVTVVEDVTETIQQTTQPQIEEGNIVTAAHIFIATAEPAITTLVRYD